MGLRSSMFGPCELKAKEEGTTCCAPTGWEWVSGARSAD